MACPLAPQQPTQPHASTHAASGNFPCRRGAGILGSFRQPPLPHLGEHLVTSATHKSSQLAACDVSQVVCLWHVTCGKTYWFPAATWARGASLTHTTQQAHIFRNSPVPGTVCPDPKRSPVTVQVVVSGHHNIRHTPSASQHASHTRSGSPQPAPIISSHACVRICTPFAVSIKACSLHPCAPLRLSLHRQTRACKHGGPSAFPFVTHFRSTHFHFTTVVKPKRSS